MKILIASRDRILASTIVDMTQNHAFCATSHGDAALTLQHAKLHQPDVVFIDLELDRSGSIVLLSQFKQEARTTPLVVAIVRDMTREDSTRLLDAGFDWVLKHPLNAMDVLSVMGAARVLSAGRKA